MANVTTTMPSLHNILILGRNSFQYHAVNLFATKNCVLMLTIVGSAMHVTNGKPSDIWAQWRLAIDPGQGIKDGYEVVASMKNDLDVPTTFRYKHTVGTSVTEGSSTTLTQQISEEMNINFGTGPLSIGSTTTVKFSAQWSKSSSTTWSTTTEVEAEVEVPAKKILVSQLQGTYGPLIAHSNHLMISYE